MKLRKFYALGIDHKLLNMTEREDFLKTKPEKVMEKLFTEGVVEGYVVLSTCLRVEFYFYGEVDQSYIMESFDNQKGMFLLENEQALEYLFRVVCGFESVIKGEDQILAQIKKAHTQAFEKKRSNVVLNVIFNRAIEIGKKFRTVSRINHNALSLEAISLKFIKKTITDLKDRKIFILGTGDLSKAILFLLQKEGVEDITITNRSSHKAYAIRETHGVDVVGFDKKNETACSSGVIISATSAPHYILKYNELKDDLKGTKVFLDLAVPRDIEEEIGSIDGISLFNLDDIWNIYEENISNRDSKLVDYFYLIEEQIKVVRKWFYYKNKVEEQ